MKKLLYTFLALTLSTTVTAQEFTLSPVLGTHISGYSINEQVQDFLGPRSTYMRPNIGIEGSLLINEQFSINLGLHYSRRGSR